MAHSHADIINRLQKEILIWQGYKPIANSTKLGVDLGVMKHAFPNSSFPLGSVHEILGTSVEDAAAANGFIAALLTGLMRQGAAGLWISSSRKLFPPALKFFGINPDHLIFIDLQNERDVLWVMEEALKCVGLAAVVGEVKDMSFTTSRRLQLAVEQSRVSGFVFRRNTSKLNVTACVSRWRISTLPSELEDDLPGVGFPRWKIELLKVRNGKPGTWNMEWINGQFRSVTQKAKELHSIQISKTG